MTVCTESFCKFQNYARFKNLAKIQKQREISVYTVISYDMFALISASLITTCLNIIVGMSSVARNIKYQDAMASFDNILYCRKHK